MEGDFITRREHEEFARRMETENQRRDDENKRQNERIKAVEAAAQRIGDLTVAIEKMAINIGTMATEIKNQGIRLERLESKPAKRWDNLVTDIIKLVVAALIGFVLAKINL